MKKWILVLVLLLLPTFVVASTAKYPMKLNDGKPFKGYANFNDMYFKIYEDANVEDIDELIMRALDSDEFTMEERSKMGQGIPALAAVYKNASQAKQKAESQRIRQRIEFEQRLLRQENDMKRRSSLSGIFYNGNHTKDAPFDIVIDLNKIDKAFVGKKATKPDPLYTHIKYEDKSSIPAENRETMGATEREEEEAFAQRSDALDPASPYDEDDGSIAGSIENATEESFKEMDSVALLLENPGRNIFDPAERVGGIPLPAFPMPGISSQPPENTEETDSTKIKQNTAAENVVSHIKQLFTQDAPEARAAEKADTRDRSEVFKWIGMDMIEKQQYLQQYLDMWGWISSNNAEEMRRNQLNASLDQLNILLDSFRDESETRLQWAKKLANKPS